MNDTAKLTRPEISGFVDQVRARLADLTEEEREELVGGLEADLSALVPIYARRCPTPALPHGSLPPGMAGQKC